MSRLELLKRPQVFEDLREQADFYALDDPDVALRFLDAAKATFQFLTERPRAGAACRFRNRSLAALGLRRWPAKGFRRLWVIYRALPAAVEVVRVLHVARDVEAILAGESTGD